jgi:putative transposase
VTIEARDLITRLARENRRCGKRRVQAEIKRLGIAGSYTTTMCVLHSAGIEPELHRGPPWADFLRQEAKSILACDFFTIEPIKCEQFMFCSS